MAVSLLLRAALAGIALGTAALPATADSLWLQPARGGQAEVRAGTLAKPLAALPALKDPKASQGGQPVPARAEAARFAIDAGADAADLRFTAVLPGAQGVLTHYQARLGRRDTAPANDLELVPTTPGGSTFRLMWKGKAVAAAQVNIETAEGWSRTLRPDADGSVTLTTPFPGLYVLEVSARVDGKGASFEGRDYPDVRHTATLSFEVPAR
ncbi:hypothetical protein [Xenophilus azovorans]|uniref:hypothetical protein n=1 Tax=Xenophilus azovorans TaxID=151755 RepID=UPI000B11604A|nr:hypothetical protein [Xenophilus azovorans]